MQSEEHTVTVRKANTLGDNLRSVNEVMIRSTVLETGSKAREAVSH